MNINLDNIFEVYSRLIIVLAIVVAVIIIGLVSNDIIEVYSQERVKVQDLSRQAEEALSMCDKNIAVLDYTCGQLYSSLKIACEKSSDTSLMTYCDHPKVIRGY